MKKLFVKGQATEMSLDERFLKWSGNRLSPDMIFSNDFPVVCPLLNILSLKNPGDSAKFRKRNFKVVFMLFQN